MARHEIVASFPSSTVRFDGGVCIIGGDATSHAHTKLVSTRILIAILLLTFKKKKHVS